MKCLWETHTTYVSRSEFQKCWPPLGVHHQMFKIDVVTLNKSWKEFECVMYFLRDLSAVL